LSKKLTNKRKIAVLAYYHFPCDHPVLENVFAKEIGSRHDLVFLLQGNVSGGNSTKWFNSNVLLSRKVSGRNWIARILNKCLRWYKIFQLFKLLRDGEIKIVLMRDLPLEALMIIPLRSIYKFKLYFQYSAPHGDMNISSSKLNKGFKKIWLFVIGYLYNLEISKVLKRADLIFPITEFHKKKLLIYTSENKIIPITMGIDESLFKRSRKEITFLKNLKKKYFLLGYFGSLSLVRNIKFVIKTFAKVRDRLSNCKLILMGNTNNKWEKQKLKLLCNEMNIYDHVIFTGRIERQKLMDWLSYCDLSLCAIPPKSYYRISSPTKLYESLANGTPVVANKGIYEQEKVILESGGGFLVDYDPNSFCNAIIEIIKDKNMKKEMGEKGRAYVIKNYTYQGIANKITSYFA
jgi:glycosyltransferase involved in cell wall biosynthesis